jgi:RPA family protein
MAIERVPAVVSDIKRLRAGTYVEMPGWDPNYVIIDKRIKASRVNLIGIITLADTDGGGVRYTLTDGTGDLLLRSYEGSVALAAPGDPVIVVGRPRSFQNEIFLAVEIIRPIDQRWAHHRKRHLELLDAHRSQLPVLEAPEPLEPEVVAPSAIETSRDEKPSSDTERIYALIESLDPGDGIDLSDVLIKAQADGIENAEKAIDHMLEMGDIFEIRAGKLKVL